MEKPALPPRKPVAYAADVLAHQHSAELLEAGGRVVERPDDRLPLGDRERQHRDLAPVRVLEFLGELRVVDKAGELGAAACASDAYPHPP